ncbi:hypothetical protein CBR_g30046 [Chara braunii]|uniref:Uncharacterized protein n=1 Tax=Chara braunii TaxID=69332 RepID=A0A388LBX0_CHABU|nr:hypothetical protein CBR_g30046 [Chara braunii]|eukprot:GBG79784.1 hypothetical protein CBR_g30046 [Chara braunii]
MSLDCSNKAKARLQTNMNILRKEERQLQGRKRFVWEEEVRVLLALKESIDRAIEDIKAKATKYVLRANAQAKAWAVKSRELLAKGINPYEVQRLKHREMMTKRIEKSRREYLVQKEMELKEKMKKLRRKHAAEVEAQKV